MIDLPYFNLARGGGGLIVAGGGAGGWGGGGGGGGGGGWPGHWMAEIARDEAGGVRVVAGQEFARFRLHAGEAVRTPLVVLQAWSGTRVRAQNVWRRWMIAHNLPRPGGRVPRPRMFANS